MSPVARRGLIIFPLVAAFLGGVIALDYGWRGDEGIARNAGPAPIGGPFTLTDENGVTRSDTDFRGKLMLVYFGYAFCPDTCPTTLLEIGSVLDVLGPAADQVQPLFLTVDPDRDTVAELKLYGANFSPRILMLTGSPAATDAAAKAYHVFYQKVPQPDAGKDDYLVDHTSLIYLMGRDGKFLTAFAPGGTPQQMADRIKQYL